MRSGALTLIFVSTFSSSSLLFISCFVARNSLAWMIEISLILSKEALSSGLVGKSSDLAFRSSFTTSLAFAFPTPGIGAFPFI